MHTYNKTCMFVCAYVVNIRPYLSCAAIILKVKMKVLGQGIKVRHEGRQISWTLQHSQLQGMEGIVNTEPLGSRPFCRDLVGDFFFLTLRHFPPVNMSVKNYICINDKKVLSLNPPCLMCEASFWNNQSQVLPTVSLLFVNKLQGLCSKTMQLHFRNTTTKHNTNVLPFWISFVFLVLNDLVS